MDSAPPPFSLSAWTFDGSHRTRNSVGNPSEHGPSKGLELPLHVAVKKSVCPTPQKRGGMRWVSFPGPKMTPEGAMTHRSSVLAKPSGGSVRL